MKKKMMRLKCFSGALIAMGLMTGSAQAALLAYDTFAASSSPHYSAGVYLHNADIVATNGNSTCIDTNNANIVGFDASKAWTAYGTGSYFDAYYGVLKLNKRTYSQDYVGRKHTADMTGKTVAWARVGMRMFAGTGASDATGKVLAGWASSYALGSTGGATVGFVWDDTNQHWNLEMRYNDGNTSGAYATVLENASYDTVYNFFWSMDDPNDTVKVWLTTGAGTVADCTDAPDLVVTNWAGATVSAATYFSTGFQYTGDSDVYIYDAWLGDTPSDIGMLNPPQASGFLFVLRGWVDTGFCVAPTARGNGSGADESNAAAYTDSAFWSRVQGALESNPIAVTLLDGNYTNRFDLSLIGDAENSLVLSGENSTGTVFCGEVSSIFSLYGCQNMVLENLNFTGSSTNVGYAFRVSTTAGIPSHDIVVRNCDWYDMPGIGYGASGVHYGSHHVTFENCTFKRIGYDSHAHMMYNAYNATNVSVIGCYFEDCSGSYVRFRAASNHGVVSNCTFVSTQTYVNKHPSREVFVDIPTFNDVDPGDETFALYASITGNSFQFNFASPSDRNGIRFYHSGFDPPGWHYLMTSSEGFTLKYGSSTDKANLLRNNCGIDFNEMLIHGNTWQSETDRIVFASYAGYGATSKGWTGYVNVSDIVYD